MSTVSTPRKSRKVQRLVRLLKPFDQEGKNAMLRITMVSGVKVKKQEVFEYFLDRFPSDFGEAFLLEKTSDGTELNEEYHVLFSEEGHTCECPGFLGHDHCKHIDALKKLREKELI